jgi:hypothetical protein
MTANARISAVFPQDGLLHVASNTGLTGATPATIVRFLGYLAAGYSTDDARERVMPKRQPLSVFDGSAKEQTHFPEPELQKIHERYPGKTVSWALRYHMAIVNGATDRQAEELAEGYKPGRPIGSKDSYQRVVHKSS